MKNLDVNCEKVIQYYSVMEMKGEMSQAFLCHSPLCVCACVRGIQTVHGMQAIKVKNDIRVWKVPIRELGHFCVPADLPFSPVFLCLKHILKIISHIFDSV